MERLLCEDNPDGVDGVKWCAYGRTNNTGRVRQEKVSDRRRVFASTTSKSKCHVQLVRTYHGEVLYRWIMRWGYRGKLTATALFC